METTKRYDATETRQILDEALREEARVSPATGLSFEEICDAGQEAGIAPDALISASQKVGIRRSVRVGIVATLLSAALLASALLLLPQGALGGWRGASVILHNEHRSEAIDVDLLVPRPGVPIPCDAPPSSRLPAEGYCLARTVHLEARQRTRVTLPRPTPCPQVWVNVRSRTYPPRRALFTLPAGIEFERHGGLDQKGLGRPNMYPPPEGVHGGLFLPKIRCPTHEEGAKR